MNHGIEMTYVGNGHWKCSYQSNGQILTRILTDHILIARVKRGDMKAVVLLKDKIRQG